MGMDDCLETIDLYLGELILLWKIELIEASFTYLQFYRYICKEEEKDCIQRPLLDE